MKKLWTAYKSAFFACAAVILLYLFLFACGITCPIKFFTGISCPGCGMTRAWLHALSLDFSGAFTYHPLWFTVPLLAALWLLFHRKGAKRACSVLLTVFILLMLTVYGIRMFTPQEVVVYTPEEGFLCRVLLWLCNKLIT